MIHRGCSCLYTKRFSWAIWRPQAAACVCFKAGPPLSTSTEFPPPLTRSQLGWAPLTCKLWCSFSSGWWLFLFCKLWLVPPQLSIVWPDQHTSVYDAEWLKKRSFSLEARQAMQEELFLNGEFRFCLLDPLRTSYHLDDFYFFYTVSWHWLKVGFSSWQYNNCVWPQKWPQRIR